jgi:hypothetical protein
LHEFWSFESLMGAAARPGRPVSLTSQTTGRGIRLETAA